MAGVDFGLFDWIDRGTAPISDLYRSHLELVEMADRAGFFAYHVAEHHGTPLGMAPSPGVFLAAAAARTKRIRLGPLVFLLPLYEPLRLVEEICMLDHLSGGRLELGLGRGVSPYELGCFNVESSATRAIFEEAIRVLVEGLTHDRLTFEGKYFHYRDVPIELHPAQQPYPPIWYPTHNPESIVYAARNGFHFAGLGPASAIRRSIDVYREAYEANLGASGRLNAHAGPPKLAAVRQVFVAETDEEALRIARPAYQSWYRSITKLWHDHADHSYDALFSWDGGIRNETVLIGSPVRVREQVERLVEQGGCNYVIAAFAWGTLTHAESARSLELFAGEVMPGLAVPTSG